MNVTRIPLILALLALVGVAGCAGYNWGVRSLYPPGARTIYVPIFQCDSHRRYLGERLTEAVAKEIERRSGLQLVPSLDADLLLNGRIAAENKRVLVENRNDDPRDIEANQQIVVSIIDRTGTTLRGPIGLPVAPVLLDVGAGPHFVPEGGQSIATAQQQAIERLAVQIVEQLEMPW